MNLAFYEELTLRHRHNDGAWSRLEPRPAHHDSAEHDTERSWKDGRIFACTTCDEQVMVAVDPHGDAPRG
jgi:hypothetical protein